MSVQSKSPTRTSALFLIRLLLIPVLLTLTACASVPLRTMWQMRNFDPLTADPNHIRFAVISNEQLQLQDGSTSMTLSFIANDDQHSFSHTAQADIKHHARIPELARQLRPGQKITLFAFTPEDAAQMQLAQAKLRAIKSQDIEGNGSLSFSVTHGCIEPETFQTGELIISMFAKFEANQAYLKVLSELNLLQKLDKETKAAWSNCEVSSPA